MGLLQLGWVSRQFTKTGREGRTGRGRYWGSLCVLLKGAERLRFWKLSSTANKVGTLREYCTVYFGAIAPIVLESSKAIAMLINGYVSFDKITGWKLHKVQTECSRLKFSTLQGKARKFIFLCFNGNRLSVHNFHKYKYRLRDQNLQFPIPVLWDP